MARSRSARRASAAVGTSAPPVADGSGRAAGDRAASAPALAENSPGPAARSVSSAEDSRAAIAGPSTAAPLDVDSDLSALVEDSCCCSRCAAPAAAPAAPGAAPDVVVRVVEPGPRDSDGPPLPRDSDAATGSETPLELLRRLGAIEPISLAYFERFHGLESRPGASATAARSVDRPGAAEREATAEQLRERRLGLLRR